MERALVLITLLIFFHCLAVAQLPIPAKYDGFTYKGSPVLGESVLVEAFFDPLCPDSRDSWPPLKKALQFYNPRVSLIVHPFPLPYHSNSFLGCRALHIANNLNSSYTYPLLELFFEHQETFYNAPTYAMTRASVVNGMVQLATKVIGENLKSAFRAGYNDSLTDAASRFSFKYGCSRGVTGTPAFFVNGIPLPGSAWSQRQRDVLQQGFRCCTAHHCHLRDGCRSGDGLRLLRRLLRPLLQRQEPRLLHHHVYQGLHSHPRPRRFSSLLRDPSLLSVNSVICLIFNFIHAWYVVLFLLWGLPIKI